MNASFTILLSWRHDVKSTAFVLTDCKLTSIPPFVKERFV